MAYSSKLLLTTAEAAELLNLKPQTLRVWRSAKPKQGPDFVKLGKGPGARIRYRIEDLMAWAAGLVVRRPGRPKRQSPQEMTAAAA